MPKGEPVAPTELGYRLIFEWKRFISLSRYGIVICVCQAVYLFPGCVALVHRTSKSVELFETALIHLLFSLGGLSNDDSDSLLNQ